MKAIEFQTELRGRKSQLAVPPEIASQLPEAGRTKVIHLLEEDGEDAKEFVEE